MSPKKPVSPEDSALFRDTVGKVTPLNSGKHHADKKKPPAIPRQAQADDRSVMDELLSDFSENDLLETGEHISYTSPGVKRSELKNLKSGKYAIQAHLDLHGFNRSEAREMLSRFLRDSQEQRHHCVRIVHGKGRKTVDQPPVLKPAVAEWLMRQKSVLAFCSARNSDGGTGALYVLLRRMQHNR